MEKTLDDTLVMDDSARVRGVTKEYRRCVEAGSSFRRGHVGRAEPRFFSPPLRDLTSDSSLGFEVIEFAREILGVELYPWQKVLLIRALELLPSGQYRFRRVIVLVGRQNGKTMLASVLAAWWLFVDSKRFPDRVPPVKFKVVGVAQNLDIAREPWNQVKLWADPEPETEEDADLALSTLQQATAKVVDTNGKESIQTLARPHYEIRAAASVRGKPATRVLFDELREQKTWAAWNAVSLTTKSFWSGQLWAFTNAGDATSTVLVKQRLTLLADIDLWQQYVESGLQQVEDFANGRDLSMGLFEWSAPRGCSLEDVDGILQANPSIGHSYMTVEACLADAHSMDENDYRTEVLCQWVTSMRTPFLDGERWEKLGDADSRVAAGARRVLGVCVAGNREFTTVGVAGARVDGLTHLEVIAQREGNMWVLDFLKAVREKHGIDEVALQAKGVPSAELVQPLVDAGFVVHRIEGTSMLNMAGRLKSAVERSLVRHRMQPALDLTVANGTVKYLSKMPVWDLFDSPVDAAPVVCVNAAMYVLETVPPPEEEEVPPPPPQAELVDRGSVGPAEVNLAVVGF